MDGDVRTRHKRFTLSEGIIVLGTTACAYILSLVFELTATWRDGVVYTAMVFATVIAVLRPAWRRGTFWKGLAVIFTGHMIVLFLVLQELSPRRFGLISFVLFGGLEAVFIGGILWKEMTQPKSREAL